MTAYDPNAGRRRAHTSSREPGVRILARTAVSNILHAMRLPACALAVLALVACGDVADQGVYEPPEADAGADADAADEASCDEDGDGFEAEACGGPDCCDTDPNVHPGQEGFFDAPSTCGTWDFDCSGSVEVENDWPVSVCRYVNYDGGVRGCPGGHMAESWLDTEPDCGEEGQRIAECGYDCEPIGKRTVVQRCR